MTLTPAATDNHADNPKQITAPRQADADNWQETVHLDQQMSD